MDLPNSEERLRALTESAAEAVVVIQDGRVKYLNARGREIFGCPEGTLASLQELIIQTTGPGSKKTSRRFSRESSQPSLPCTSFASSTAGVAGCGSRRARTSFPGEGNGRRSISSSI